MAAEVTLRPVEDRHGCVLTGDAYRRVLCAAFLAFSPTDRFDRRPSFSRPPAGCSAWIVNINPFMRFDGYYIFADLLGVENLQPRAFPASALAASASAVRHRRREADRFGPKLDATV